MKNSKDNFSVALGLFDYINPICYAVTVLTIILNYNFNFNTCKIIFIIGAIISMIFGLTIPTVKLMVGLGKFKFKMPVNLVFYVNSGILLSGSSLIKDVKNLSLKILIPILILIIIILLLIYLKKKKFNTIAVLTGAFGYIFIYTSLISLSILNKIYIPVYLYITAIIFFLSLIMIGIKANLKDARVHWVIESCNVLCQLCVAIGTIILFIK